MSSIDSTTPASSSTLSDKAGEARARRTLDLFHRIVKEAEGASESELFRSICVNLRAIAGDVALVEALRDHALAAAKGNRIFRRFMAANAITHQPPLGFFRQFVLDRGGEHKNTLDLK